MARFELLKAGGGSRLGAGDTLLAGGGVTSLTITDPVGVSDTIGQQASGMVHRHDVLVLISA